LAESDRRDPARERPLPAELTKQDRGRSVC